MKVLIVVLLLGVAAAVPMTEPSKVSPALVEALKTKSHLDIVIAMAAKANPMEAVANMQFETKGSRARFVRDTLLAVATESQAEVATILSLRNAAYKSSWIINAIFVSAADKHLIEELAHRLDIESIDIPAEVPLHVPVSIELNVTRSNANEWGIAKINAPAVWSAGNTGEGVVVANIDTGVRWTHEALSSNYRGAATRNNGVATHDYNWFAPTGLAAVPNDGNGHGTHTMGTIAGQNGVGVAPGATWVACKGCSTSSCSQYDLTTCGEWMTCPTDTQGNNPDCDKAPDTINNSWGGGQNNPWYDSIIQAWIAAGIVPIFSAGNSGPSCGTSNSPGDSRYTTSVGATDINDVLASFSSRGPARGDGTLQKPEVSAPGVNVRSAWNTGDSAYAAISGTSMAGPHVAGTTALILSVNSKTSAAELQKNLEETSESSLPKPTSGLDACGGTKYTDVPNFLYGYGRIDACEAVKQAGGKCSN